MSVTAEKRTGFTIVELLIVIIVIAILAAISVVAYRGIQERSNDAAVQADLKNYGTAAMQFAALHDTAPGAGDLVGLGVKATKSAYSTAVNNLLFCHSGINGRVAVVAQSKSGNTFAFSNGAVAPYSDHGIESYVSICNSLAPGSTGTRGYWLGVSPGWRDWTE